MLLVDTYIDKSPIHGVGVFAKEDIAKGTIVWEYNPLFDITIRKPQLHGLPEHVLHWFATYTMTDPSGDFMISIDNHKYTNHSLEPNCGQSDAFWIASQDIKKGEEMTYDYTLPFPESSS